MRRKTVEPFTDKVSAEKLAIVQLEHQDTRFTEEIDQNIRREIGQSVLRGDDIRIISSATWNVELWLLASSTPYCRVAEEAI